MLIGRVLGAHGLRGEVKVVAFTESMTAFTTYPRLFLAEAEGQKRLYIRVNARRQRNHMIVQLEGCDCREQAEALRGQEIWLDRRELPPLNPGEIYLHQLQGKRAKTLTGRELGLISTVIDTKGAPILVIRDHTKEILIPAVASFITQVEADWVVFDLPLGLVELGC